MLPPGLSTPWRWKFPRQQTCSNPGLCLSLLAPLTQTRKGKMIGRTTPQGQLLTFTVSPKIFLWIMWIWMLDNHRENHYPLRPVISDFFTSLRDLNARVKIICSRSCQAVLIIRWARRDFHHQTRVLIFLNPGPLVVLSCAKHRHIRPALQPD